MSDGVIIAIITVVIGGMITGIWSFINSKADRAKTTVAQNKEEVVAIREALAGVRDLANELRSELKRKEIDVARLDDRVQQLTTRNADLEDKLIEERSITLGLLRELGRREGKPVDPRELGTGERHV